MNSFNHLYLLALMQVTGIGVRKLRYILEHHPDFPHFFERSSHELQKLPALSGVAVDEIANGTTLLRAEQELNFIRDHSIQIVTLTDAAYPKRLLNCYDAPPVLFTKGQMDLNARRIVAVVGTRKATDYGRAVVEQLIEELKPYNATIVSGLAFGIDALAHKNARFHGLQNIAVLGHGLDTIYPAEHRILARELLEHGGLVAEYFTGTKPDKGNFPERNRIVCGMCDATIVVESRIQGGSIVTAEIAYSYNLPVFAVPGKLTDKNSEGCNLLIKAQKALMYTNIQDLEYHLGWKKVNKQPKHVQPRLFDALAPEEQAIVEVLQSTGRTALDDLADRTGMSVSLINVHLLNLEMSGTVRALPGKWFELR